MKKNLIILATFIGALSLSSCEKEYMGPLDAAGNPVLVRGGEGETNTSSGGGENGVTDTGHDSDYDNTGVRRNKKPTPTTTN